MATVFDVDAVDVVTEDETQVVGGLVIDETIDVMPPASGVIEVEVAGPKGDPGVQNVYAQSTNPATIPGEEWGPLQEGYIWLEI